MVKSLRNALIVAAVAVAGLAGAYTIKDVSSDRKDVYCNSGAFVGSMYLNNTGIWSDGLRADANPDVVAKQMVAAQGSSCQ